MNKIVRCIILSFFFFVAGFPKPGICQSKVSLDSLITKAKVKYDLPAVGLALITDGKLQYITVTGVRKYGDTTKATIHDTWHLGSCTKAFTATLIGCLVEAKVLGWETTIGEVFPELQINPEYKPVTIQMLLCHKGGFPRESWPKVMSYNSVLALRGTPQEQRFEYVKRMLMGAPEVKPGAKFSYSNAGFVVACAMVEKIIKSSYEELVEKYIFHPLDITTAGYGAMNTPGQIDEPWHHIFKDSKHIPVDADATTDSPIAKTSAGRMHMSLFDWSKFAFVHLVGADSGWLLKTDTWRKLHSLPLGDNYGFGWGIAQRNWAHGIILTHSGSNGKSVCSICLAPEKRFGVLVVTNQGGEEAQDACDEIIKQVVAILYPQRR